MSIFHGKGKPNNLSDYLKYFIEDVQSVTQGYINNELIYHVEFAYFVCDAPSRLFLKCAKVTLVIEDVKDVCRLLQKGVYKCPVTFPLHNF